MNWCHWLGHRWSLWGKVRERDLQYVQFRICTRCKAVDRRTL